MPVSTRPRCERKGRVVAADDPMISKHSVLQRGDQGEKPYS
jgi:hypothetical protein